MEERRSLDGVGLILTKRGVGSNSRSLIVHRGSEPHSMKPPASKMLMSKRFAIANGGDPIQQRAAADAIAVQDAVNLVAAIGCLGRHLLELQRSGICGDDLINHPVSLAFTSKLNSLCRMSLDRELAALDSTMRIENGGKVEYEVIPL
jgi:hypothetical protein